MSTCELRITLPPSLSEDEARLLLGVKLYEMGKVSLEQAAKLSGFSKRAFTCLYEGSSQQHGYCLGLSGKDRGSHIPFAIRVQLHVRNPIYDSLYFGSRKITPIHAKKKLSTQLRGIEWLSSNFYT